jgi:uncharacterized membrane protein YkvA (DUF1232 family)
MNDYEKHYDEENFWKKASKVCLKVGRQGMETILAMYYCMKDPDTPYWAKAVIAGALGYFIFPFDLIPDVAIGVGYVDDIGILASAVATVGAHLKEEHWEMARAKTSEWFD